MASGNLQLEQQINKAIAERAKIMRQISNDMKNQVSLAAGLQASLQGADVQSAIENMRSYTQQSATSLEAITQQGESAESAYRRAAQAMSDSDKGFKGLVNGTKSFTKSNKLAIAGVLYFGSQLKKMGSFGKATFQRLGGTLKSVGTGIKKVGLSILSIPYKMFKGLFKMASSGGGGTELRQAYESVRKEFGSLKEGMGAVAVGASKQLQAGLAGTGLSARRVFGNMAERIKVVQQLFTDMGPKLVSFTKELSGAGAGRIAAFQKGLGLSADGLQAFAGAAKSAGTTLEQQLSEVNNLAQQLGPTFAGSAKMMARQMGTIKKMPQFIQYTNKELAEAVAYSSQLGVEAGKLAGVLDKFDSFDSAAESADALNQAFGANVDVMKLMQANTAAERTEMLRKSMAAAGKDAATMTRQQLKALAASTGLDEATAKATFSLKNQGKSLEDIKKASKDAEKKPLSQAEAMGKLADSIERLVKGGGSMGDGFFGPLMKGFSRAVTMSGPFRGVIKTIQQLRRNMYKLGFQLGKMFSKSGAFGKFMGGLTKTFSDVLGVFKKFNADMSNKDVTPEQAFENMLNGLENIVSNFFEQGNGGSMMVDGLKEGIGKGIKWIGKHGLPWLVKTLTKTLTSLGDIIKNIATSPEGQFFKSSGLGEGAGMFQPILDWYYGGGGKEAVARLGKALLYAFEQLLVWWNNKGSALFTKKFGDVMSIMWKNLDWKQMITLGFAMGGGPAGLAVAAGLTKIVWSGFKLFKNRGATKLATQLAKDNRAMQKVLAKAAKNNGKIKKKWLKKIGKPPKPKPGMFKKMGGAISKMSEAVAKRASGAGNAIKAIAAKMPKGAAIKAGAKTFSKVAARAAGLPLTLALIAKDGYDGFKKYGSKLDGQLDARGKKISSFNAGVSGVTAGILEGALGIPKMLGNLALSEETQKSLGIDEKSWSSMMKDTSEGLALIGNDLSKWGSSAYKSVTNKFSSAGKWINETFTWDKVGQGFEGVGQKINEWSGGALKFMTSPFKDSFEWVSKNFTWENIKGSFDSIGAAIKNKAKQWGGDMLGPFKRFLPDSMKAIDARSPSKHAEKVGEFISQGIKNSLESLPVFGPLFKMFNQGFDGLKEMALKKVRQVPLLGRLFGGKPSAAENQGKVMSSYSDSVNQIAAGLDKKGMQPKATATIKKVAKEINAINNELGTVDGPTLGVSLTKFAKATEQNVASMTLKRGNTSIKFGVSVNIDAKQLAQELAKTKIGSGAGSKSFIMFTAEEGSAAIDAKNHAERTAEDGHKQAT